MTELDNNEMNSKEMKVWGNIKENVIYWEDSTCQVVYSIPVKSHNNHTKSLMVEVLSDKMRRDRKLWLKRVIVIPFISYFKLENINGHPFAGLLI